MVVSAEKARQKAEARRLRILAKANERLDVVSGLVPSPDVKVVERNVAVDSLRADDGVVNEYVLGGSAASASLEKSSADERENKGSKRMAAMRRRRTRQIQRTAQEDEKETSGQEGSDVIADLDQSASDGNIREKDVTDVAVNESVAETENELDVSPSGGSDNKVNAEENDETSNTTTIETSSKKSYMGVAKMRRKILKQQKAERLQSITDSEALHSDVHMERELAAEMAVMGVTAKMVREGVDVCDGRLVGGVGVGVGKHKWKKGLFALLLPPMHIFSRLVTLVVLFGAGLRIGIETHSITERSLVTGGTIGSDGMIHHVESSLTKPWEYGMGGKVAYMVGKTSTAPPTSLNTDFYNDTASPIDYIDEDVEECKSDSTAEPSNQDDEHLNQDDKIQTIDMEDEFDTGRVQPRGVTSNSDDIIPKTTNIDPFFKADLDDILSKSALPFPFDQAARFAIKFHRIWVYYLWTLPTLAIQFITGGWIKYPPVVLIVTLLIRAGNKVLLGGGKKLEEEGANAKNKGGFDIMKTVMDTAKGYIEGTFPWLVFILGTLYDVVKVDMYVVFCGLLVGLVMPLHELSSSLGFGSGKVLGDGEL